MGLSIRPSLEGPAIRPPSHMAPGSDWWMSRDEITQEDPGVEERPEDRTLRTSALNCRKRMIQWRSLKIRKK